MKRNLLLGAVAIFATVLVWSSSYRSAAQARVVPLVQEELPSTFIGRWQTISYSVAGRISSSRAAMTVDRNSAQATLGDRSIRFLRTDADKTQIEVCSVQDEVRMGGGGPRKAICRVNAGVLEIIEARSAAYDFPKDFSPTTKDNSVYWTLSPASAE